MRFSIRWKVLALVSGVLTAAMVTYLALAITLVRRDKIVYIYDLNASLARTLSAEVQAALETVSDKAQFFARDKDPDTLAAHFFAGESDLLQIEAFARQANGLYKSSERWTEKTRLASANLTDDALLRSRKEVPIPWETIAQSRRLVQNVSVAPDIALLQIAVANDDRSRIVICTLRPDRLLRVFGQTDAYAALLVDARGIVIVDPDPKAVIERRNVLDEPLVREALSGRAPRGVRPIDHGTDEFIGAFARMPDLGVAVITETPRSEALKTSRALVRTSILFALAIFFGAVLASIFFSRRLVAPLRQLHQATEILARGDFRVDISAQSRDEVGDLAFSFSRMVRDLAERDARLDETRAQLAQSEKLAVLGAMSAEISHEIKNPMASILGFAQLGASLTSLDEAKEHFATIAAQTRRAKEILENVLKYTRQEQEQRPTALNEIIEDTLRLVQHQASAIGARLKSDLAEGLPAVLGNSGQLQQVILNLALNALQAMEEKPGMLTLRSSVQGKDVIVEIIDTGPGMSAEVKAQLFRPFFTTKPRGKGTGLGLSVSQNLVQQHRGSINIESEVGKGTTVRITIPPPPSEII